MKAAIALLMVSAATTLAMGAPALGEEGPPAWAYPGGEDLGSAAQVQEPDSGVGGPQDVAIDVPQG